MLLGRCEEISDRKDRLSQLLLFFCTTKDRFVESATGTHLVNYAIKNSFSVHYLKERNDEVDFVLQLDHKIIAQEDKSTLSKTKTGLQALQKRFNPWKT